MASGFYVAYPSVFWVDSPYKIGHTNNLKRRLDDLAYTTFFPPRFCYAMTVETATPADARAIETAVRR